MSKRSSEGSTRRMSLSPKNEDFKSSKLSAESAKTNKVTFSLMDKRQTYRIVVDGVDLTPQDITDENYMFLDDSTVHAAFDTRTRGRSESSLEQKSVSKAGGDQGIHAFATTISLNNMRIDHTINSEEMTTVEDVELHIASSTFLPKMKLLVTYPSEIFIVLKETDTTCLFELPSLSCEKGTPEANIVEENNEFYQYITVGKGRNRKMVTEETQTQECVLQSRHTLATAPQTKNAATFASLWDMHDTYARLAQVKVEEPPDEMVLYQSTDPALLRKKKQQALVAGGVHKGKSFDELSKMPQFLDAVLLTERVLASLEYTHAQKMYRGLINMDPLSLDLVYVYSMNPLWTLTCKETENRPISSISFNAVNKNILAVGYGKFTYAEDYTGLICIWCTKNPCQPERVYHFPTPVSSVAFSDKTPNWLGCGFTNGDVIILDITSYAIKEIARSKRDTNPCFEPIWSLSWRVLDFNNHYLIATCQDGRINKFTSTKTHDFICSPMMRLSTVEGKLKGIRVPKKCIKEDVPIIMNPGALCVKWHPVMDHIYIVGSNDGCIHKCSKHYLNQHVGVLRVHSGPVYSIDVSPFLNSLYATCGADGAVRLWLEGIDDVILTLNCPAAVYDIAFCPFNSTIIIAVSGNILSIWDLRRKTHMPCAEYTFPGQVVLTQIMFAPLGDNVFVADTWGRVHTFHLEDTPIPPFNQKVLLEETLKKALCTRPQILNLLEKMETFTSIYIKSNEK